MKQVLHLIIYVLSIAGCMGSDKPMENREQQSAERRAGEQSSDVTAYTQKAAMAVYGYQPERALQIIDSAVIVGNLSEVWADVNRVRILSQSQMKERLDSLLGGPEGVRLDTARAIGERLLLHDSLNTNHGLRQDVLEMLIYTARQQEDTLRWLQRSRELVEDCRKYGAETKALRTEAELGAAMCYSENQEQGLAMLDSVIYVLQALKAHPSILPGRDVGLHNAAGQSANPGNQTSTPLDGRGEAFRFNELDAFIIAAKRKIGVLNSMKRFAETLPLSHRITELLDDYEQHPDRYHDGSFREPKDTVKRADYIRYYRSQAQGFVTAAYAALGERGSMEETFYEIASTVRDVTAREHQARYNALQQQLEAERQRARANNIRLQAVGIAVFALLALCFAVVVYRKNRDIRQKNRILAQQLMKSLTTDPSFPSEARLPAFPKERGVYTSSAGNSTVKSDHSPLLGREAGDEAALDEASLGEASEEEASEEEVLYHHIRDEVLRLQLYTDPGFGRQSIIERFHLTKDRASRIFSQGSEHSSISDFITDCRLDHARRLLVSRPDMSIADIATASGFGLRTTFTRSFKAKHGLTPTEFREQQEHG